MAAKISKAASVMAKTSKLSIETGRRANINPAISANQASANRASDKMAKHGRRRCERRRR